MAPGSSLGGARPKCGVADPQGALWIAKFPARSDDYDHAAWEMLVHQLAVSAGLRVPEARLEKFTRRHRTFLVRRFDRGAAGARIHFASAMTMIANDVAENVAPVLTELGDKDNQRAAANLGWTGSEPISEEYLDTSREQKDFWKNLGSAIKAGVESG